VKAHPRLFLLENKLDKGGNDFYAKEGLRPAEWKSIHSFIPSLQKKKLKCSRLSFLFPT